MFEWSKKNSLPGLGGIPLYDILVFINLEIKRDRLITRANSIAYSFFLSLFPSLLALFTLIPYILPFFFNEHLLNLLPGDVPVIYDVNHAIDYNQTIINHLSRILPDFSQKEEALNYIYVWATQPRADLLSISFILAIFFASNGMLTLMRGFEKSYKSTYRNRNVLQKRIIAIYLTFLLGLIILGSLILILFSTPVLQSIFNFVGLERFGNSSINFLGMLLFVALLYALISMIYRQGASMHKKFSFFSAGATLATTLSLISTTVFSFYVNKFDTYNELYDSIGTIIIIMLWIQINAFSLLVGYELNASIAVNRDIKKEKKLKDQD